MLKLIMIMMIPMILLGSPKWYRGLDSTPTSIIGYGVDENVKEARAIAFSAIAQTVKVQVTSEDTSVRSAINDKYLHSFETMSSIQSNVVLEGSTILKEEYQNGNWYVAIEYDSRSLIQKIKDAKVDMIKTEELNYLHSTALGKTIQKVLGYNTILSLYRDKYRGWVLEVGLRNYALGEDLTSLFTESHDRGIKLSSTKSAYNHDDNMGFIVESNKGFISILYVEESGKVGILRDNEYSRGTVVVPNRADQYDIKAYNITGKSQLELYIVLESDKRIDLREFEFIQEFEGLDDHDFKFDKLLNYIEKYSSSSIKIKING